MTVTRECDTLQRLLKHAYADLLWERRKRERLEDCIERVIVELGEIDDVTGKRVIGEDTLALDWRNWPERLSSTDRQLLARVWEILNEEV